LVFTVPGQGFIQLNAAQGESVHADISVTFSGANNYTFTNVGGPLTLSGNPNGTWSQNGPNSVTGNDAGMGLIFVSVNLTDGNDTVTIPNFQMIDPVANALQVSKTGDGSLAVTLGNSRSLPSFSAPLSISNSGGAVASLTLDDSADTTATTIGISGGGVNGLTAGGIGYFGLSSVTLRCGPVAGSTTTGNIIDVTSTSAALNVLGSGSLDTVTIGGITNSKGFVRGAQAIRGPVSIANPGGTLILTVDDSADIGGRSATITSTSITGLAPATISYTLGSADSLAVEGSNPGSSVTNNWSILDTPAASTVLYAGNGINSVNVSATESPLYVWLLGTTSNAVTLGDNFGSVQNLHGSVFVTNLPAAGIRSRRTLSRRTAARWLPPRAGTFCSGKSSPARSAAGSRRSCPGCLRWPSRRMAVFLPGRERAKNRLPSGDSPRRGRRTGSKANGCAWNRSFFRLMDPSSRLPGTTTRCSSATYLPCSARAEVRAANCLAQNCRYCGRTCPV
jgi:hypothetical protein